MTQLSDTQTLILSTAAQRPEHFALPLPESLRGAAAAKVIGAMLAKGFLEEVEADIARANPSGARPATGMASRWLPPMQALPPLASNRTSPPPPNPHPRRARRARAPSRRP